MRVLLAAELGALAAIRAGLARLQPGDIGLVRDQIELVAERRHPERMDHIICVHLELHRLADRDVDLVRGVEDARLVLAVIAHLPPPLMTDDLDRDLRVARRALDRRHRVAGPHHRAEQRQDRKAGADIDP